MTIDQAKEVRTLLDTTRLEGAIKNIDKSSNLKEKYISIAVLACLPGKYINWKEIEEKNAIDPSIIQDLIK